MGYATKRLGQILQLLQILPVCEVVVHAWTYAEQLIHYKPSSSSLHLDKGMTNTDKQPLKDEKHSVENKKPLIASLLHQSDFDSKENILMRDTVMRDTESGHRFFTFSGRQNIRAWDTYKTK